MTESYSKLVIGTANFGLRYGLKNDHCKLDDHGVHEINKVAKNCGINTFDTASAYGDAENRLSLISNDDVKIITKIGVSYHESFQRGKVIEDVGNSLENIKQTQLYSVLLHRPEVLLNKHGKQIWAELEKLREIEKIKKIGISIYSPDLLPKLLSRFNIEIIQVPFNIFDQRILTSGWVDQLKSKGIEIHIRSVFLQGLVTFESSKLPNYFKQRWTHLFERWFDFIAENKSTAADIALSHCLNQSWADRIVVGVDDANQLLNLVEIERRKSVFDGLAQFSCEDPELIEPSNWKKIT